MPDFGWDESFAGSHAGHVGLDVTDVAEAPIHGTAG